MNPTDTGYWLLVIGTATWYCYLVLLLGTATWYWYCYESPLEARLSQWRLRARRIRRSEPPLRSSGIATVRILTTWVISMRRSSASSVPNH